MAAPWAWTPAVIFLSISSAPFRYWYANRGMPVVDVGWTRRLPVMRSPAPPLARSIW